MPSKPLDAQEKKPSENPKQAGGESSAIEKEQERLRKAAEARAVKSLPTDRLEDEDKAGLPPSASPAYGTDIGAARWYRKIPLSLGTGELPKDVPHWRVELHGLAPAAEPLGLDVLGDAVVGRGRVGNEAADIDLDVYGGLERGVSRRHALLRPTANHLYIIDLGSTNGTQHNGMPLGPGIARALKHNDTVTLGRVSFTVKIVKGPPAGQVAEAHMQQEVEADGTKPLDDSHPSRKSTEAGARKAVSEADIKNYLEEREKTKGDDSPPETKTEPEKD